MGQPARWIEVIDTYDITFQHRPGRKHGNADALSRYPCKQCGGRCKEEAQARVRVMTRSQMYEPGWIPEELAAEQAANLDVGPIFKRKLGGNDQPTWEDISPGLRTLRSCGDAWSGFSL